MEVVAIDPEDDGLFDEWYSVVEAAYDDLWPGEPGWQKVELKATLRDANGAIPKVGLGLRDGNGLMVGASTVELPEMDNQHLAVFDIGVLPGHRRRGAGRTLLQGVEELAAARDRNVVAIFHEEPHRQAGSSPGRGFATAMGYDIALINLRRDLTLPVPVAKLDALEAAAAELAEGYSIFSWQGPWPDQWIEDRLEFGRRMSTDTPLGEFELHEEVWDEARVRQHEALLTAMDRLVLNAAALHEASGRLVAFTELAIPRGAPSKGYQQDTLVLREHRGHRLGTLVKVANMRRVMAVSPQTRRVATWNADSNRWMIDVNEALGFEVRGEAINWQKRL